MLSRLTADGAPRAPFASATMYQRAIVTAAPPVTAATRRSDSGWRLNELKPAPAPTAPTSASTKKIRSGGQVGGGPGRDVVE